MILKDVLEEDLSVVVIIHKFYLNSVVRSPTPTPKGSDPPTPTPKETPGPKGPPGPPKGPRRPKGPWTLIFNIFLRLYYIFSEQVPFLMSFLNNFPTWSTHPFHLQLYYKAFWIPQHQAILFKGFSGQVLCVMSFLNQFYKLKHPSFSPTT